MGLEKRTPYTHRVIITHSNLSTGVFEDIIEFNQSDPSFWGALLESLKSGYGLNYTIQKL